MKFDRSVSLVRYKSKKFLKFCENFRIFIKKDKSLLIFYLILNRINHHFKTYRILFDKRRIEI